MGVIKKADRSIEIKTSVSEETLYIPSSDDERGAFSQIPTEGGSGLHPRVSRHNIPTVGFTCPGLRGRLGKKKSRRYQNVTQLVTLAEEDEPQEVTISDFVGNVKTPFTALLEDETNLQKWEEFVSGSEERQREVVGGAGDRRRAEGADPLQRRLSLALRNLVKKKSLPLGMLQYLEQDLVDFFCKMPTQVYVSPALDSFQRLLLHSLSDYHRLVSLSFDSERCIRLVRVRNPRGDFPLPNTLLVQYLQTAYKVS